MNMSLHIKMVTCPSCLGGQDTMVIKKVTKENKSRRFTYIKCKLCKGEGVVPTELADDFEHYVQDNDLNTDLLYE